MIISSATHNLHMTPDNITDKISRHQQQTSSSDITHFCCSCCYCCCHMYPLKKKMAMETNTHNKFNKCLRHLHALNNFFTLTLKTTRNCETEKLLKTLLVFCVICSIIDDVGVIYDSSTTFMT